MLKKTVVSLLAMSVILAGCSSKLDGTYASDMVRYTFKSNGTVVMDSLGGKVEVKYELDGKDVRIMAPGGAVMIMTLVDENTIEGPMGIKLTKQE